MFEDDFEIGNLDHVEASGFDPIPSANYELRAVQIELKDTRDLTGKYINVQFEVLGPNYAGRMIFSKFNVKNRNPQAVEIALGDLKAWLKACGKNATGALRVKEIFGLEGIPFIGRVKIEHDKTGQNDPQNVVKGFKPLPQVQGQFSAPATPAAQQQAAPAQSAPMPNFVR